MPLPHHRPDLRARLQPRGAARRASAPAVSAARVTAVISNNPRPPGLALARARTASPTRVVDHRAYADRAAFDAALAAAVDAGAARPRRARRASCASSTRRSSRATQGRLLNIHPSLLPLYPGCTPTAGRWPTACAIHGCTVHFVTRGARPRADRRPGRRARCTTTTTRPRSPHACSKSSTGCCRAAVRAHCEGRLVIAGNRVRVVDGRQATGAFESPRPD